MRFGHRGLSQWGDADKLRFSPIYTNRIAQWTAEALECDVHDVSICQADSFAKTEAVGTKEVDMNVSRTAVCFKFEVMMLNILQAVAHFSLAASNLFRPQGAAGTMNRDDARHGFKFRIKHKFGSDRAGAQL